VDKIHQFLYKHCKSSELQVCSKVINVIYTPGYKVLGLMLAWRELSPLFII